jgi:glycosyltransferase involved in cell wall biosynthesis
MSTATLEPPILLPTLEERPKRLLLIAYNFPPVGGAGVQRPAKWAKYLGQAGWDVTVLTTENPSVPVRDESLLHDLPADVNIIRARTWEPDYRVKKNLIQQSTTTPGLVQRIKNAARGLASRCVKIALQPDPQVLWNYDAIRVGSKALREHPHDAILVTAPAYSSFYIGAALKRRFGLPLVLDYRDEWDLSGKYLENAQRDWISRLIQSRMQRRLLCRADAVVATTQRSTQALAEKLADLRHPISASCIYNGFDTEDFAPSEVASQDAACDAMRPERGKFRLVYIGTLWNLTDINPLVCAIEHLDNHDPQLSAKLELVCVGRKTPEQLAMLNRLKNTAAKLITIDYCEHSQALQWLRSASSLCLLLSDVPGADRVVPAKLFEYLAIRKDMLTISPSGETAEIVRRFYPQGQFAPNQVHEISHWLKQRLVAHRDTQPALINESALDEFSRKSQTRQLADLLNTLVASHSRGRGN